MRSPLFYYLAFFATGIATVSVGALVASHGALLQVPDGEVGRLLGTQFAGQLTGSYFVGRHLSSRLRLGALLTAGAMLAQVVLAHLSLPLLFVMGVGLGLAMASINTLVGLESPDNLRAKRLERLNIFWPLGAAFGPWIIAHAAGYNSGQHALAFCFTTLAVIFAVLAASSTRHPTFDLPAPTHARQTTSSLTLIMSLFALLAVGVESGLANWLPTFQARYLSQPTLTVPLATLFWGCVLAIRLVVSHWLAKRLEGLVFTVSLLVASLGSLGLVWFHTPRLLVVMVAATAFAIGPIYPMLLTQAIKLPRRGLVFFSASAGSALFPWFIGWVATLSHTLRGALLVPAVGSVLLFLLTLRVKPIPSISTRSHAPPPPAHNSQ